MATTTKSPHPQWATKHRVPGTELRLIRGNYYLYEYKTIYDKEKKKPRKISGKLIGTITQKGGLITSEKRKLEKDRIQNISGEIYCKEYGMSFLVANKLAVYKHSLEKSFGDIWVHILAIAYCRFVYRCPLKNIPFRLAQSFLPELLGIENYNEKTASGILKKLGGMHQQRLSYMKSFVQSGDHILMDVTNILSNSHQIGLAKKGYSNSMNFDQQFNLMYIFSSKSKTPVYYRLLPGNIREVKAFKNCLLEAGLYKSIIIADKGFYSQKNIELMDSEKLNFLIPLKRDNSLIDYKSIADNTFKEQDSFFEHEGRIIWFRKYPVSKTHQIFLFLDETLRLKEENDYLRRISSVPESYSLERYHLKRNAFGTIAIFLNLKNPQAIDAYQTYKSRMSIETMFDGMKNILEADHTYMQNEQTLQGWMFINHIALQWYQSLYMELKELSLLKKHSVSDYINFLSDIKKLKINGNWFLNESTNYTQKFVKRVGISLD
jgi:hypothetical protein